MGLPIAGRPLLEVLLERMRTVGGVSGVALATSVRPENDALAAVAEGLGIPVCRGDEDDCMEFKRARPGSQRLLAMQAHAL